MITRVLLCHVVCSLAIIYTLCAEDTSAQEFRVGAARVDITPAVGEPVRMSGYADRKEPLRTDNGRRSSRLRPIS